MTGDRLPGESGQQVIGRYFCQRVSSRGGRWEGVVEVRQGAGVLVLRDVGVWRGEGMAPVAGEQRLVWGDGFVEVHGFVVHRYEVTGGGEEDFRAEYRCGDDVYWMEGEVPRVKGWQWRMGVKGPRKDEVQEVRYVQQKSWLESIK